MKKRPLNRAQKRWIRDQDKEDYWKTQLRLWQESGLSVRAFCKERGLIETSFYAWRRELIVRARENGETEEAAIAENSPRNSVKDSRGRTLSVRFKQTDQLSSKSELKSNPPESTNGPFVPLSIVQDKPQVAAKTSDSESSGVIKISTPSGYQICISKATDLNLLNQVLSTLENLTC